MSTGITIDELAASTSSATTQEDFVRQFPYPILVEEAEGADDPAAAGLAYRVCPKDRSRNDGPVTIGRKQHQDIVVNDGMISSLHAHFTLEFDANDERVFYYED